MTPAAMLADGYKPHGPTRAAEDIDAAIVARMTCPRCKSKMRYDPWTQRGSYVALAVCVQCGHEIEF